MLISFKTRLFYVNASGDILEQAADSLVSKAQRLKI